MKWKRGVCILVAVLCFAIPTCAAAQGQTPNPPTTQISRLLSTARAGAVTVTGENFTVYFNSGVHPGDHLAESLAELLALMEKEGKFGTVLTDRPLEIYVLNFADYQAYSRGLRSIFLRQHPEWQMRDDIHMTLANFLPVPEYRSNVILTYSWEWTTIIHELSHVAIMRLWDVEAALDHDIVYGAQRLVMRDRSFFRFLERATQDH